MSAQPSIEELLQLARSSNMPRASDFLRNADALRNALAKALEQHNSAPGAQQAETPITANISNLRLSPRARRRLEIAEGLVGASIQDGGLGIAWKIRSDETSHAAVLRALQALYPDVLASFKSMVDWVEEYETGEALPGAPQQAQQQQQTPHLLARPVQSPAPGVEIEEGEHEDAVLQAISSVEARQDESVFQTERMRGG